jgi:UDP-N-acetylmuramoylalanine--D-glutamate ligase
MDLYVADKRLIYQNQDRGDITVAGNDGWGRSFHWESRGRPLVYSSGTFTNGVYSAEPLGEGIPGGWIPDAAGPGLARLWEIPGDGNIAGSQFEPGSVVEVVPAKPLVPGIHQKQNLLAAALALLDLGLPVDLIRESLGRFEGIKHRLEFFHESGGIRFYNDSAATIPEAAAAAVNAFERPRGCEANLVLVSGGTDKELDFAPLAGVASRTKALILLAGTGSEKLRTLLDREGVRYRGPFDSLDKAINAALEAAVPGDNVVLSPGCASFGMFINEFDRGDKWKEAVRRMA